MNDVGPGEHGEIVHSSPQLIGTRHGDRVMVRAEGEDEEAAVKALVAILSERKSR